MRSSKAKALLSAIREDYERAKKKKMDPQGPISRRWNNIFLVACLISLFADPMFFYLPVVKENLCIDTGTTLEVILTIVRSLNDAFYMIQIYVRFRTAYEAPSSRVFWRGELVTDYWLIAKKYLFKDFWIDLIASLPLPQVCCNLNLL